MERMMPSRSMRPCAAPGCGALVLRGRCDQHRHDARGTRQKKYDKRSWRDGLRLRKLAANPLCEDCEQSGLTVPAAHVDHRDGNADNDAWENLRSLCAPCHSRKTVTQDGGFGRSRAG